MSDSGSMIVPPLGDDANEEGARVIGADTPAERFVRGREFVPTDLVRAVESGALRIATAEEQLRLRRALPFFDSASLDALAAHVGMETARAAAAAVDSLTGSGFVNPMQFPGSAASWRTWRDYFACALDGAAFAPCWEARALAAMTDGLEQAATEEALEEASNDDAQERAQAMLRGVVAEFPRLADESLKASAQARGWRLHSGDALNVARAAEEEIRDLERARRIALHAADVLG